MHRSLKNRNVVIFQHCEKIKGVKIPLILKISIEFKIRGYIQIPFEFDLKSYLELCVGRGVSGQYEDKKNLVGGGGG